MLWDRWHGRLNFALEMKGRGRAILGVGAKCTTGKAQGTTAVAVSAMADLEHFTLRGGTAISL